MSSLRRVVGARTGRSLGNITISSRISSLFNGGISLVNSNAILYKNLSKESRKNPETLKLAIEEYSPDLPNPFEYALKEAITDENVKLGIEKGLLNVVRLTDDSTTKIQKLKYYIAGSTAYMYDSLLLNTDKDIVKYIILLGNTSVYKYLSEDLRKDSEILKLVIEISKEKAMTMHINLPKELKEEVKQRNLEEKLRIESYNANVLELLLHALPEALTNEIIDLLISNNIFPKTANFLSNKYYILQVAEKKPDILLRVSGELKNDKEIQLLSLIFHPKFLEFVECESIQQFLNDYGSKYNIANYGVKDVLKDSNFIKRVLLEAPQVYTLLSEEWQQDKENIQTILDSDGTNLIFVPHTYINADLLSLAKKSYSELLELLNDSSRILDFIDMLNYEKIFAYVLYIFNEEPLLLDKFINYLKNSEEASKEMVKIIGNSRQLFANFLDAISSNQQARQFFSEFLTKNRILIPKKISNVNDLWSPVDLSFKKTYKFIRGVVGIDKNGLIIEMSLDNTRFRHSHATARIGLKTGCKLENIKNHPFVLGKEVSRQGTLIIQIEGSSMTTFLPEDLSLEQYNSLMKILELCKEMKTIGFTHKPDDLYADDPKLKIKITLDDLVDYCNKMLKNQNELGKQNSQ